MSLRSLFGPARRSERDEQPELEAERQRLEERHREIERREAEVAQRERELEEAHAELGRRLESLAGLTREEARGELLAEVEQSAKRQAGLSLRRIEEETRLEGDRRARGILATAIQRLAGDVSSEATTNIIQLPNEEMKGRIIGREGRNIRTLESLTGVDILIDETPQTVVVSSFDGLRREIARKTLESLVADGRINPASCEEAYERAVNAVEEETLAAAEEALLEARVGGLDPELIRLLGRLRFRTSYGQNVLDHLVECANLASMMAAEVGADAELARRGALLHDIGKAVSHEAEGSHAAVGARIAARHGEPGPVVNAIAAHHGEVEPETVEAVLVQAADAISAARPGARGGAFEDYVQRLAGLEEIARRQRGVRKAYALRAGRELRVIVDPGRVSDEEAVLIGHEIAKSVETGMEYPGRIQITVIRESRSTTFAE